MNWGFPKNWRSIRVTPTAPSRRFWARSVASPPNRSRICKATPRLIRKYNFLHYYGKMHSKLPIFRVKSVKIYTGQKKFTRASLVGSWQKWGVVIMKPVTICVSSALNTSSPSSSATSSSSTPAWSYSWVMTMCIWFSAQAHNMSI